MTGDAGPERVARLEAEIETLRARLARSERALTHSEKLMALGQLISGVAHELANPLTAVIARASLIGAAKTLEDARRHASIIEEQGQRATTIVRNLSSFVRRRGPERSAFTLAGVVRTVVELHGYQLQASNVRLVSDIREDLPPVDGDAHQMEQVLLNLVMNAQYAMVRASGGGQLTIRTLAVEGSVRLVVEDDGPGIPDDRLEQVFEPFFSTKGEEGTGLGLAISRDIVAAHRGRIWAEAREDRGARIVVELPARGTRSGAASRAPAPAPARRDRGRFLVVDDETDLGQLITDVLRRRGYQAEHAGSASAALARIREEHFDGILTDIRMPTMTGDELWRLLERERPELARRTIFMTGHYAATEVARALEETGRPCLTKPFQFTELDAMLATLDGAGQRAGAGPARELRWSHP